MRTDKDFHALKLRGQSFRDQDLTSADFTKADVRGADFRGAQLANATFRDARIGIRPVVGVAVLSLALALCLGAGITIGLVAVDIRGRVVDADWDRVLAGVSMIVVAVVFLTGLLVRGLDTALRITALCLVLVIGINVATNLIWDEVDTIGLFGATSLLVALGLAILAGVLGRLVGGTFGAWATAVVAALGGAAAGQVSGGISALVVSVLLVVISNRALRADPRDRPIRRIAHPVVSHWGTNFSRADLTNVDFTGSHLLHSDVENAILTDATWEKGKGPLHLRHKL